MKKTTSSYVMRAMHDDEKIIYAAGLHWIVYQAGVVYVITGGLIGHVVAVLLDKLNIPEVTKFVSPLLSYISVGVVAVGALLLVFAFIKQISTELVVTNQRVIAKHGLISTTSYELMMTKVEGATIDQSIWGRLWGYGTLMVKGTGGGISPIDHVAQPFKFHTHLMEAIHESNEQNHSHDNHG